MAVRCKGSTGSFADLSLCLLCASSVHQNARFRGWKRKKRHAVQKKGRFSWISTCVSVEPSFLSTETTLFMDRSRHFILLSMKRRLLVDANAKQPGLYVKTDFRVRQPISHISGNVDINGW